MKIPLISDVITIRKMTLINLIEKNTEINLIVLKSIRRPFGKSQLMDEVS
jgi:hypothetical protein